jgi:DNA polymerase
MDTLAALRLHIEWGADEALDEAPVNRLAVRAAVPVAAATPAAVMEMPGGESLVATRTARPPAASGAQIARQVALACADLEALRAAMAAFEGCALATTATNMVFADGSPESGLMLVGDVPGAEEDRAGRPFVGPAGLLLDKMLASVALDRTKYVITNLVPWRPPGNRPPTEIEIAQCLPFLLRQIALVRPRHLVLLGGTATNAILGGKSVISRQRGRWVSAAIEGLEAPVLVLPMVHPSHLLRNGATKAQAWADLILLRRTLDSTAK